MAAQDGPTGAGVPPLLSDLRRVAAALGPAVRPPGSEQVLTSITLTAQRLFRAQACSLALLTEDESELVYTTASGNGAADVTGMRLPSGKGIAGWVVMSGQPVAVSDLHSDSRFARDVAEQTGYVPEAMIAVPVVADDRVLGVLTLLDRDDTRAGADQDMALLTVFAEQAALLVQTERALADLGRVLLQAVSAAAGAGTDLAQALAEAADDPTVPGEDADLTALAALFADLQRQGPRERRLAVTVVRQVAAYTADSSGRSSRRRR